VNEGFVNYLDVNEKRHIAINPFLIEEIRSLINKVKLILGEEKVPEFTTNANKCKSCGLKQECYDNKLISKRIKELNRKL